MSGHSKWNNIKNKKGKEDARKGKVFTKLARYIMVAAKEGGPDPDYNPSLKAAIEKAKAENMPNDNIERAIKKGIGELGGQIFEEIMYEGYGPSGIAIMVNCLTDNRNRTASDVRHAFDKFGGNLGQSGSVSFLFDKKGILAIEKNEEIDEEELTLLAIDLGAEDIYIEEDGYQIITDPKDFSKVEDGLKEAGYNFIMAEISYIPQTTVTLTDEKDIKNMNRLLELLEDSDDVQEVYHNWEMPEEE
ncbi:MAG TPA: YebC/PmpR family DNA-binding transcriptional regulator [Soehngenia sp.]|nr:YebC/PmpR family DNA-binding transcriptional regulator [Soehngenia sp.]HPP31943.1 YebC/PmpR family DNA-binding transcriptional regulator [Soehngenia sp.]